MKWIQKCRNILLFVYAIGLFYAPAEAGSKVSLCNSLFLGDASTGILQAKVDQAVESLKNMGLEPAQVGDATMWKIDGKAQRSQDTYENSFESLFEKLKIRNSKNYFEATLQSFRKSRQTAHVLDLFGSGVFLPRSSSASSVTGVRLEPLDWARAGINPREMPTEVLGDITSPVTWQKLDESMSERGIPKMDLVTMRPEGGWFRAPWYNKENQNIEVLSLIVRNVALRLHPHGHFYFDVPWPEGKPKRATRKALKHLQQEIENLTPFTLVLLEKIEITEDLVGISGVLLPKQLATAIR